MGYQRRVHGESIIKVVLVASQTLIIDTSSIMKYILLLKICSIFALHLKEAPINRNLTDTTEEEFLDFFGLPDIDDQEEKERRREVLKEHQDEVKEIHEKFANGGIDWDASIPSPTQKVTDLYPSYRTAKRSVCRDTIPSRQCMILKKRNSCNRFLDDPPTYDRLGRRKKWSFYCPKTCKKC